MAKAKQSPGGVAAQVENLVRPVAEGMGLILWDVRFEKEGSLWLLRVLVDRADGLMDTDTCEALSKAIDPLLDEADPIEQSYCLEVGSPGLGRKLTKPAHFEAMKGRKVLARLYKPNADGHKELSGILENCADGVITLQSGEAVLSFPLKDAGSVKLCDDEDLFDNTKM